MTVIQSPNSYIHIAIVCLWIFFVWHFFGQKAQAKQINTYHLPNPGPGKGLMIEMGRGKGSSGEGFYACRRDSPPSGLHPCVCEACTTLIS